MSTDAIATPPIADSNPTIATPIVPLEEAKDTKKEEQKKTEKMSKKKYALVVGYNGTKFYGSQIQSDPKFRTVEGELVKSLHDAKMISDMNILDIHKIKFSRATRTDKYVHALQNFFSVKLLKKPEETLTDMKSKILSLLPPDMRLFSLLEVTKKFNSKISCSHREYIYLMPSFCFLPIDSQLWKQPLTDLYAYRMDDLTHKKLEDCCKQFIGTHKYHNYTREVEYKQAAAMRYILEMNCSNKIVMENIEFIQFFIKGQSFLYNQIRNMVGIIVDIMRNSYSAEVIMNSFKANLYKMPLAPGEGLILERVCYDKYNEVKKQKKMDIKLIESDRDELESFKKEIVKEISLSETERHAFSDWINSIIKLTE